MKKILIPILILPLMLFTGCSEDEEAAGSGTGSSASYTISDLVGTWETVENTSTNSINIDYVQFYLAMYEEMGYSYTQSEIEAMLDFLSAELEANCTTEGGGTWSGYTCSTIESETVCCTDGQSEVTVISDDGTFSQATVEYEGADEETSTGTLVVSGSDVTMSFDDDDSSISGTLDIASNGTTATFVYDITEEMDSYFTDYLGFGTGMTFTSTVTVVVEKVTADN